MAAVIWYSLQSLSSQGRLLFPQVAAISLVMATGILTLRIPPLLICAPMMAFSITAPILYMIPAYDHPQIVDQLPDSIERAYAQWDDVELVGHALPRPQRWSPGDDMPVTLYWRPLAQSSEMMALFISLIDDVGKALATIVSFPGWGTLPTTWWEPGAIYRDDYVLQIPADAEVNSSLQMHIGWYAYPEGENIRPTMENGEIVQAFILPAGALVGVQDESAAPDDATLEDTVFGDRIRLEAYRWRDGNVLELYWQLLQELSGDWRVFAVAFAGEFLQDADNQILLQRDAVPAVPLDYLRSGESFVTKHEFEVGEDAAGEHAIYLGWYDHAAGVRLAVSTSDDMLKLPPHKFSPKAAN